MYSVKQIIQGYAKKIDNGWLASSSTILIQGSEKNILVDSGINKLLLLETLEKEELSTDDIDIIFMTHFHPDHIFLVGLFDNAIALDGETIYTKDLEEEYIGNIPGTNIKLLPTPGHANEHTSLIVENENGEVIVVAQDVFWWTDQEEQIVKDYDALINKEDPFMVDFSALKESRRKVLEIADYIIPGHGKMFENLHKGTIHD